MSLRTGEVAPLVPDRPLVAEAQPQSAEDVTQIMNRLANSFLPEETVCDAMKRLKGADRRMSPENGVIIDQITEDRTILCENGHPCIYQYKRDAIQLKASIVPQGFTFDAVTGYYYNSTTKCYFDIDSGLYSKFGMWYTYNFETMTWVIV